MCNVDYNYVLCNNNVEERTFHLFLSYSLSHDIPHPANGLGGNGFYRLGAGVGLSGWVKMGFSIGLGVGWVNSKYKLEWVGS